MKRTYLLFCVILFAVSLAGCSAPSPAPVAASQPVEPTSKPLESAAITPTRPNTSNPPTPTSQTPASAAHGDTWRSPVDGMLMAYIPAGAFQMGSEAGDPDEMPVHTVYLDAFWMDITEVTNAMYAQFVEETKYQTAAEKEGGGWVMDLETGQWHYTEGANWRRPQGPSSNLEGLRDHPVVMVSWDDAQAYCAWAERRLPTEAEWEKAARGSDGRTYPWGEQDLDGSLANFADCNLAVDWADTMANDGCQFTAPVGSYPLGASPYGLLDMAGNVWEWVWDWYDESFYQNSPDDNPTGPTSGEQRLLRGGSWANGSVNLQAANRSRGDSGSPGNDYGFRCAR